MERLYVKRCGDQLEGYVLSNGEKVYKIFTFSWERIIQFAKERRYWVQKTGNSCYPCERSSYKDAA